MNAVLAKPIHAIWFIQARAVDLDQSLAAALFADLPSWLRDHPSAARRGQELLRRTIKKFQHAAPSPISANTIQPTLSFNCATSLAVFWNAQHRLTNS
jgi:hypothetical protein